MARAVRVRGSTTGAPKAHSAPSPRRFRPNSTRRRAAAPHFATPCPTPRAHATTAHPAPAHSRRPNPLVAPCAALPSTAAPPSCGENRDAKAPCANFPDTCRAWRSPFRGAPCVSARLAPVLGRRGRKVRPPRCCRSRGNRGGTLRSFPPRGLRPPPPPRLLSGGRRG